MRELEARRNAAIQQLISLAETARATHQLGVAAQDYKRVLSIEPGNPAPGSPAPGIPVPGNLNGQ